MTDVGLHIIVDGEVGVVLEDEELAMLETRQLLRRDLGAAARAGRRRHRGTLAGSGACSCLRRDVETFLLENPGVMLRMLQTEARRLRSTDELRT